MAAKKVTITTKVTKDKIENIVAKPQKAEKSTKGRSSSGRKATNLSVDVLDIKGKVVEQLTLPEEIFGAKANTKLIAQAVRVYLANQRAGSASTKTRAEVIGSTRKIYRQKGTGRARHGAAKAPIFVHGGVAHGPKPKDYSLSLTKNMRQKALFGALAAKLQDGGIKVVTGLDKIEPKTKVFSEMLKTVLGEKVAKKVLLVVDADTENKNQNIIRAGRNIEGVAYTAADRLNAYEVVNSRTIVMVKDAVQRMESHFLKKGSTK
jgi:large subunit ribosomal protein L4